MALYPTCCLSEFCGRVLCDGCSNRPQLVQFYRTTKGEAGVETWEANQSRLAMDKQLKRGIWAHLRDRAELPDITGAGES